MLFTYTYRDSSGAVRRDCVEAGSRAEAVSLLRSRNIFPLSLKEDPKGRNAAGVSGSIGRAAARSFNRWLVICVVFFMCITIVWLWKSGVQSHETSTPRKVDLKHEGRKNKTRVKKSNDKNQKTVVTTVSTSSVMTVAKTEEPVRKPVWTPRRHTITNRSNVAKSPFKNMTEQLLVSIFARKLGDPAPPLPTISQEERQRMAVILSSKNEIVEDDDEMTVMAKEALADAKEELKKYLKDGGDIDTFLSYYHRQLRNAYDKWQDAQRLVMDMNRTGESIEAQLEFIKTTNAKLAESGIKPVIMPPKLKRVLMETKGNK